ncbi:MAG: hypothetical protein V9E85_14600 [Candidatus Nanopelagicales bacterium]|jgi:hypothetical protein
MTNPAPRPALRKAPDADIHPAQGQAASVITLKRAVDVPIEQSNTTQIDLRNRETADLRQVPVVTSTPVVNNDDHDTEGLETVAKKSKKGSSKSKGSSKKKNDKKKKKSGKGKKKKGKRKQLGARTNKRIDLTVEVPPSVRRALRSGAKARGTSVEDRVDSVVNELRQK